MKIWKNITVAPLLPKRLARLTELAYNFWWCWNRDAVKLFRRIDRERWETTGHNPVALLGQVSQERFQQLDDDSAFLAQYDRVMDSFDEYLKPSNTWFAAHCRPQPENFLAAYFSMEFGLHEALPIYSGGLGILAADHLKSVSDLGIPLVGVGLLYQRGYMRQYLNQDGWQQEFYTALDFYAHPLSLMRDENDDPLLVEIPDAKDTYRVQVWRVRVGRIDLYLLDSNLPENRPDQREITDRLYGGDKEMRIRQEILLGIGGLRALRQIGVLPTICHMNEGHSAFLALEQIHTLMGQNELNFAEARLASRAKTIFTTHTPVPAGIDRFSLELVEKYLKPYCHKTKLPFDQLVSLGREKKNEEDVSFNMALLALRMSAQRNGVSQLHGEVSRRMFADVWPEATEDEVPIQAITNGVHLRSWVAPNLANLYELYLGPEWITRTCSQKVWSRINLVPAEELWRTHEQCRVHLVAFARNRLQRQLQKRGVPQSEVEQAAEVLRPDALTIGFARRFASYKRANLLFRDIDRLKKIIGAASRPVQVIMAGKAHPLDDRGKEIIKEIIHLQRDPIIRQHLVFLEDYDIDVARVLTAGVDIWLNTPRRPQEASGTSGMKASANGVLNLSIPDGWWDEAYDPEHGWAIGRGEVYHDLAYQDQVEANALYDLLEKEVVPCFYNRGTDGLPRDWVALMKKSLERLPVFFNTDRMVEEYCEKYYLPVHGYQHQLCSDNCQGVRKLDQWSEKVRQAWAGVSVVDARIDDQYRYYVSRPMPVWATVELGTLAPADVRVEFHFGALDSVGELTKKQIILMELEKTEGSKAHYRAEFTFAEGGRQGIGFRVLPAHELELNPFELGLPGRSLTV